MLCLWLCPPGFNCLIFLLQCAVESLLSPYLCFISFLYLDLFLLGDGKSISKGSFMRTKHLFGLVHIGNKHDVGTVYYVKPSSKFLTALSKGILLL